MEYPCFQYVAEISFQSLINLSRDIYMMCLFVDTEIVKQGDEPDFAYVMISGKASVTVTLTYKKFTKIKVKIVSKVFIT